MNGILCIDKPEGFTSHDVVAKCRGILGTRKLGHGGTLDPIATGVLPLFAGRATKACDILPNQDKRYTATFRLGIVTDTQDCTGDVLETNPVKVTKAQIEDVINTFIGDYQQVPPMFSAVRVDGRRLYDLARQGQKIERKPRPVRFYSITLLNFLENGDITVDVCCSKGTYIRTLCHDIGRKLGCGAVMTALRRTASCGFTVEDCFTLDELQKLKDDGHLTGQMLSVESVFSGYPRLMLNSRQTKLFSDGVELSLKRLKITSKSEFAVYGSNGEFLAIASSDLNTDALVMKKWFGIR